MNHDHIEEIFVYKHSSYCHSVPTIEMKKNPGRGGGGEGTVAESGH